MPPRNADERLARALILELFLTMAEQESASERRIARSARMQSGPEEHLAAADDPNGDLPAGNISPLPE